MGKASRLKRERRARAAKDTRSRVEYFVDQRHLDHLRACILQSGARRDSCIYSTRLLGVMAERWGLSFQPLTIMAAIFNPVFGRYMKAHDIYDLRDMSEQVMRELGEAGGRFIVIGDPTPTDDPTMWPGHLAGVVGDPGEQYLVDLSIDQAHRPHKQIHVEHPLAFKVVPEFLRDETVATAHGHGDQDGMLLIYVARPSDTSYQVSPDWVREPDIAVNRSPEGVIKWLRRSK